MMNDVIKLVGLCALVGASFAVAEPIVESRNGHAGGRSSLHSAPVENTMRSNNTLSISQIEVLEQEVRNLRGQLEVQEHELKRLTKSQQDLYLDLERRMQTKGTLATATPKVSPVSISAKPVPLPAAPKVAVAKPPAPVPAPARVMYESPIEEVDAGEEDFLPIEGEELPPSIPLSGLPIKQVQVPEPVTAAVVEIPPPSVPKPTLLIKGTLVEKNIYENAYNFVLNKRYPEAVVALEDFLAQYPKGQYAPNAHYWLGEVYTLQARSDKNPELLNKASVEFMAITTKFPNHQKAMDALLKLGIIEGDKGNTEAARQYLTNVKERYPGTSVARIATTHLQRLK